MTRKYDAKKAALTRKRNAKKKAQVAKLDMEKMLREQKEREHKYNVSLKVSYYAEEEGTYTVTAETRKEAEELAIDEAQDCRDGQMVGCQGFMDGDWSVENIERTDGKDVDDYDEDDEDET